MGNLTAIIAADTTGFKKSVEDAKKILEQFTKAEDSAINQIKEASNVSDSQVAAFNRVTKTLSKVSSGAMSTAQAEKALSAQVKELKIQYANLSEAAKQSDFGKTIKKSCEDAEKYLGQVRTQLEAVKDESSDTNSKLDSSSTSFDKLTGFVSKYAVQLGLVSGALKVAKDAFLSTETGADNWGKAVAGADAAYKVFLTSLNNGNWSNFFRNLNDAIGGAMELYDKLDRLGSIKTNNQAAIAIIEKQLSELRLQKQQGKNVDEEIKRAEARLLALRNQEIQAGQEAGRDQIIQAIKKQNGNISDSVAGKFADMIIKNGQTAIDVVDKKLAELEEKATVETVVNVTSSAGVTQSYTKTKIAVDKLSDSERALYNTLKAVHDAEGDMAAGLATYTNAVNTAKQANEATFKYNKWGNNGGTNTTNTTTEKVSFEVEPINIGRTEKQIKDEIKALQEKIENTPDSVIRIALIAQKEDLEKELKDFGKNPIQIEIETKANNLDLSGVKKADTSNITNNPIYVDGSDAVAELGNINDAAQSLYSTFKSFEDFEEMDFGEQFFTISDAIFSTIDAISRFGDSFTQLIDLINTFKTISQATTQQKIALNQQEASSNMQVAATEQAKAFSGAAASGAKLPFPANLAAIAASIAAVVAALSMIGKFADGGIVQGSRTIGDMNIARVNSGEMILNGSQQKNLFNLLDGGMANSGSQSGEVHFKIQGKDLVGVLSNYNTKVKKVL